MSQSHTLAGGFTAPAEQGARAFRALLQAMARPGRIEQLTGATPPLPLSPAAGALALVLLDGTTPVHLAGRHDCAALRDWLTFHTGAPMVGAKDAAFAFGDWAALMPVTRFAIGNPAYPDRSATLVIELPGLQPKGAQLSGPGIETRAELSLPDTAAFAANHALFPLGFDAYLTAGDLVAGLPRSTKVEEL